MAADRGLDDIFLEDEALGEALGAGAVASPLPSTTKRGQGTALSTWARPPARRSLMAWRKQEACGFGKVTCVSCGSSDPRRWLDLSRLSYTVPQGGGLLDKDAPAPRAYDEHDSTGGCER